jgi:hypothetical protein
VPSKAYSLYIDKVRTIVSTNYGANELVSDKAILDFCNKAIENKLYQPLFEYKNGAVSALTTNMATPIVTIEWMKPITNTDDVKNDTLKLDNTSYLSLHYRLSSTLPLNKETIKVLVNEKETQGENNIFTRARAIPQTVKQTNGNTLYIYDLVESVKLYEKTSIVKATYQDYSSPKVVVWLKQMPHLN